MNLFYELLQVSVGTRDRLSKIPTDEDWSRLYEESVRQSLVGIVFSGIERLHKQDGTIKPPASLLYQWLGNVLRIEQKNKALDLSAVQLSDQFKHKGLRSCVLKGQGLARLYPIPQRRQPGDIDLWVEGSRESTLRFLQENSYGIDSVVVHHTVAHIIDGVETEIHFLPSYTYNYLRYIKYKRFFKEESGEQFCHFDERIGFSYPTNRFNAVYLMLHIFRHVFHEGIGLRQFLDYYFILRQLSEDDRKWAYEKLEWLGLKDITGAVMYVLQNVFLLENSFLLCAPSQQRGSYLIAEIEQGGNFGKYDERYKLIHGKGKIRLYIGNLKRLRKVFSLCPSEVLWAFLWKPSHWIWRKYNGYV